MIYTRFIVLFLFIITYSCDKDGTVIVNPPTDEEPFVNDIAGNGCGGDNLCYALDDIYYDFSSSSSFEIDYYKFNSYQLQSGSHNADDPSNILTLKSFDDTYFIGIPTSSIDNGSNEVLVIDDSGENYEFSQQDIIYQNLINQETLDTTSFVNLSSSPFSIISNITWNKQQGRYNFVTSTSDKFYAKYKYSQNYNKNSYATLVDTVLNPIFGDIILVDSDEYVYRNFVTIDSLDSGDEIRSKRSVEFKIKDSYIPDDDALMFRKNTDCNDNYRQDDEEVVIFSNFTENGIDYADSFEGFCFSGACDNDNTSYNIRDCCESNGGMWYSNSMSCEPFCISYSINCSLYLTDEDCQQSSKCNWDESESYCISSINEQDCCEYQGDSYTWDSSLNECSVEHDYWSQRSNDIVWNDTFASFDVNADDLCMTTCSKNGESITMNDFCWDKYSEDNRATATCQQDESQYITKWDNDSQYSMTFCDRGNNIPDVSELFVDQSGDGLFGENDNQNIEPFEDRNCNLLRDLSESDDVQADCPLYSSSDGTFCDKGNGQWDRAESCATGSDCGYDYLNLFTRSVAPDQLIVNYEDQSNPILYGDDTTSILPQGNFFDTGEDGCFDIFETGNPANPCVCEFNDYHENIISCDDYLTSLPINLMIDGDSNGFLDADLNMDDVVDEFDIALSYQFDTIDFGANASAYNYGQCLNGFSGSKMDCCLHHGCQWSNDTCVYDNEDCQLTQDNFWTENLDPNNDNSTTEFDGEWQERSLTINGEQSHSYKNNSGDIIDISTYFSSEQENIELGFLEYVHPADSTVTKILDYNDGYAKGGDKIPIIYNDFIVQYRETYVPIIKTISSIQSNEIIDQIDLEDAEDMDLDSYNNILSYHRLVKTEFINSEGLDDHDYLIFKDTDEHIVKMIHPYYHFLPGYYFPQNIEDFNSDGDFWQSVHMEPDTLLYSFNGNIVDGQSFHSLNTVYSDTANYNIAKEYYVENATATLKHGVLDPNCASLGEDECGSDDFYWCAWDVDSSGCYSNSVTVIPKCLLVTRIIKTTAIGPGMGYSLKSESYFKPGYGVVREDISIYWEDLPWVEVPWFPISSIQYKTPSATIATNQSGGFLDYQLLDIEDLDDVQDFDYAPYTIRNTLGLQRIEYPLGY